MCPRIHPPFRSACSSRAAFAAPGRPSPSILVTSAPLHPFSIRILAPPPPRSCPRPPHSGHVRGLPSGPRGPRRVGRMQSVAIQRDVATGYVTAVFPVVGQEGMAAIPSYFVRPQIHLVAGEALVLRAIRALRGTCKRTILRWPGCTYRRVPGPACCTAPACWLGVGRWAINQGRFPNGDTAGHDRNAHSPQSAV